MSQIGGVLSKHFGPVTAAKTIYEDAQGYLVKVRAGIKTKINEGQL
jgi:hypothetical protein